MKKLWAVIAALIISSGAWAQTSEYLTLYKHYEGKLGNKEAQAWMVSHGMAW